MLAILLDSTGTLCIFESSAFRACSLLGCEGRQGRNSLTCLDGHNRTLTPSSAAPRRPQKIESRPQARHWRSNKTVAEGDRPSAIVENHSQLEVIAAGLRQLSESLEVASIHGSARFDFNTDQCATSRFNHKVNLVLIFVPVVV